MWYDQVSVLRPRTAERTQLAKVDTKNETRSFPLKQELDPKSEEILESLWRLGQEEGRDILNLTDFDQPPDNDALEHLVEIGYVSISGKAIKLEESGFDEARNTVRRHRLAERLLVDILDVSGHDLVDESACKFEHLLHKGIEEKICTLLGHPKTCPHGHPIPPGSCCEASRESDVRLVATLADLRVGQKGTIAYLHVTDPDKMQKLMSMGVLPGTTVSLIRRDPSYVFQVGFSQFAVDADLAGGIFVRLEDSSEPAPVRRFGAGHHRRRRKFVGRNFGRFGH